ncbi:MAG TPA: response regulator [Chthoniobacter sp.]|nr:response regulator [Chthoniobacter sp.]
MTDADLKALFGTTIKTKRSELGLSQEELADRAGLHRTYVSDVERGMRNVSLISIEKLAHALGLSVWRLFEQTANGDAVEQLEILLVEDEPNDIELTQRAFARARIVNPVHVVNDGIAALDFLFARNAYADRRDKALPGVILLDLKLPKLDGLEVLRRIRADERLKNIPVVILTASKFESDHAECRRLGINSYIVKPVDFRNFSEVTPQLQFDWKLVRHD